jgi:hypothetical protein
VTSIETKQFADGKTYYVYEVLAPYSKDGAHNLVAFTVKVGGRVPGGCLGHARACTWLAADPRPHATRPQGDLAYLFVLSANEKQWAKSEARLRTMLETFRA